MAKGSTVLYTAAVKLNLRKRSVIRELIPLALAFFVGSFAGSFVSCFASY